MLTLQNIVELDALELQQLYEKLQKSVTLASLVLAAWQIGLWFAHALVNHHLHEHARLPQLWGIVISMAVVWSVRDLCVVAC